MEMQIKTKWDTISRPLGMPKIKMDNNKCDEDVEKLKPSHEASRNVERHSCFGNQFRSSAKYST